MRRIKKGDEVIITTGKDKGRRGNVLRVLPKNKVVVEGINIAKKHQRRTQDKPGEIVDKEMPLQVSNVMLFNPVTKKGDRVGVHTLEDGKRVRIFKSTSEVVDI